MSRTPAGSGAQPDEPRIGHHYLLVILVQVAVLSALWWIAASYR